MEVALADVPASVAVVTTKKRKNVPSFGSRLFGLELGVSLCGTTSSLLDG